jgi:hypothetical protein
MTTNKNHKLKNLVSATAVSMLIATAGFANNSFTNPPNASSAIELVYVGKLNNHPTFELQFNNQEASAYWVTVKDENGDVLYTEKLMGKNISRKYNLQAEEAGVNGTSFEVFNRTTNETKVYKISKHVKTQEELVINKI